MPVLRGAMTLTLLLLASGMVMGPLAHAHLMVAQHGTLSVVEKAVFMVLSLPIAAFGGVDDNNDGKVSMVEFNNHRVAIVESVRQHITLNDMQGSAILHGIVLSPVAPHGLIEDVVSQLTIMGRFTLNSPASVLRFHVGMYGKLAAEQSLEITATRRFDKRKAVIELTPTRSAALIFADAR